EGARRTGRLVPVRGRQGDQPDRSGRVGTPAPGARNHSGRFSVPRMSPQATYIWVSIALLWTLIAIRSFSRAFSDTGITVTDLPSVTAFSDHFGALSSASQLPR